MVSVACLLVLPVSFSRSTQAAQASMQSDKDMIDSLVRQEVRMVLLYKLKFAEAMAGHTWTQGWFCINPLLKVPGDRLQNHVNIFGWKRTISQTFFFCRGALSRSMSSWLIPSMKCLPHLLAMCHYQWLPTTLRLHIFWSPDCFIFLHVASFGHPGGVEQTPWAIHSKHFKLGERGGGLAADQWASAEPDLLAKQCKTYMPSTGHAETSGKEEDENKKRAYSTFEGKSGHSMVDCRTIRSVMTDPPHPMPDIFKNGKLWFLRGRVRQDSILWCCAEGCWRTGKLQSLHRTFGPGPGLFWVHQSRVTSEQ